MAVYHVQVHPGAFRALGGAFSTACLTQDVLVTLDPSSLISSI